MEKEMLSKIKLVCSDVDGTLVEEGKSGLNPEYYDEIRRLKEKGIMFAVVSGRSYAGASPLFAPVIDDVIFISLISFILSVVKEKDRLENSEE